MSDIEVALGSSARYHGSGVTSRECTDRGLSLSHGWTCRRAANRDGWHCARSRLKRARQPSLSRPRSQSRQRSRSVHSTHTFGLCHCERGCGGRSMTMWLTRDSLTRRPIHLTEYCSHNVHRQPILSETKCDVYHFFCKSYAQFLLNGTEGATCDQNREVAPSDDSRTFFFPIGLCLRLKRKIVEYCHVPGFPCERCSAKNICDALHPTVDMGTRLAECLR